jgi:enoyl-CoA hydratase/carnithine racemase
MGEYIGIESSCDGQVALLRFTDRERGNQLCWAAIDELADALEASIADGARVLILASGLPGHWLQHASLADLCAGLEGRPQTGGGSGWFRSLSALADESIISIAAISGDSSGGGAELGWACDFRIAERQARVAQIEVNAGLTTGIGGCSRLMRLVGVTAVTDLVLTGRAVSAGRLFELGAISELTDPGGSEARALRTARDLLDKSPEAVSGLKRILRRAEDLPLTDALAFEQATFQEVVRTSSALEAMQACQAAYDSGEGVAEVHHYPPVRSGS